MEYVVVEISGKQYRVMPGDVIEVDNLNQEPGSVSFDKVLLSVNGDEVKIGKPYVDGFSVSGKILEDFRGDKIRVSRFTAKSRHRRVIGFRAALTRVQIENIVAGKKVEKTVTQKNKALAAK